MNPLRAIKRSVPARLLLIFLITALFLMVIISFAWGLAGRHMLERAVLPLTPHLVQYMDYVADDLGDPPNEQRARELSSRLPVNIHVTGKDQYFSSMNKPVDLDSIEFDFEDNDYDSRDRDFPSVFKSPAGRTFEFGDLDHSSVFRMRLVEHTVYFEIPHHGFRKRNRHSTTADQPRRFKDHRRARDRENRGRVVFFTVLGLIFASLATCYVFIRRLLRPVRDIQAGVSRMGKGELEHRIKVRRDDDLGELTGSINTMASDIEQMLDAKRQLLLGISHELRSPITRAKISAELLEPSTTRDRIADDLQEMESLVTELLETERLNAPHGVLNLSAVDAAEIATTVARETFADMVTVDASAGTLLNLDETRLRLLIRNLVGNAVRHGGSEEVLPNLRVRVENDRVTIEVSDQGPGIDPEHIEHLTDPFYRVDPSRTRATGGFGLGLYLSRLICEAHDGSLEIESIESQGTTVRAILKSGSV